MTDQLGRHPASGTAIIDLLERIVRPKLTVFGRPMPSFRALGCLGVVLGVAVGVVLASTRDLSVCVVSVLGAAAVLAAMVVHWLMWRLSGTRRLVYYRYQIAILIALTATLWLLGQPVIVYLDVAILGLGTFLVVGRLGCFMVGCCHGTPHHAGVSYGASHVRSGFAQHLEHVRLFPVQLIEAAWVCAVVVAGAVAFAHGSDPGGVCAAWLTLYGFGRFHCEFLRGDPERPYIAGFSEAQWISLALMVMSTIAGQHGVVPLLPWHVALVVMVGLEMLGLACARWIAGTGAHLLSHPRHVDQLAVLVFDLAGARAAEPGGTLVGTTSLGIHLSMVRGDGDNGAAVSFTLSRDGSALPEADARTLARWLARLAGLSGQPLLQIRDSGVVHAVFPAPHSPTRHASQLPAIAKPGSRMPSSTGAPANFHIGKISILPVTDRGETTLDDRPLGPSPESPGCRTRWDRDFRK